MSPVDKDTSAKTLLANGSQAFNDDLAAKLQVALGRPLPQMEVRVKNLSVSADVVVGRHEDGSELPTLTHTLKTAALKLSAKKHVVHKTILRNFSGVFEPGTITLVLGQPSSGKSSLMKVLSGRFPLEKRVTLDGDVTYNGVPQKELGGRLPQFVSHVDQHDVHFPTLTVKETLEFAHAFTGGELLRRGEELLTHGSAEENLEALKTVQTLFQHYPDIVIEQLGLQNCQDTILGNGMLRGVSGGERKRVTTGEMEFGMKYMTLMDEISTGLDSATAFDIISTQRSIAKTLGKTVVISLLQPSPEIFALFDDLILLNAGEVMYHGPRDQALSYFESLGFRCPPHRDVADFLLDLGTNQQVKYQDTLPAGSIRHPRWPVEFGQHFQRSGIYPDILARLNEPWNADLVSTAADFMMPTLDFQQSFVENVITVTRRQMLVAIRNKAFIRVRGFMVVVIALLYGSLFYQLEATNVQVTMGVLFQSLFFLGLGQYAQVPGYCSIRAIFYKQRRANYIRTATYVLACSASQIPWALGETIVFGSIVYWMCGFVATAANFLLYELLVFQTLMAFAAWYFFMAAVTPDMHIAKPVSMMSIFTFVAFAGFVVPKSEIPDYFIFIYWLDPIAWCLRAVAVSQYRSPAFDVCEYAGVNYCAQYKMSMGEYFLSLYDVPSSENWVWIGIVVLFAIYALFMVLGWAVLEYKRYESPEHVTLTDEDTESTDQDEYVLATTPTSGRKTPVVVAQTNDTVTLNVKTTKKFEPIVIAFQDLWYSVPDPHDPKESLTLLKGISGYAMPGSITALMGSTGAGKTTLMDVIAGRKTGGTIQGKIMLNGYEASDLAIRRCTGYCEQMDIHSDASTIREALVFSAFLRQDSSVPDSQKYDSVEECLELLDLQSVADEIVRGSPTERMKRLTIGVELAADPRVLFLDEPTSGLDARSAKLIMDGVRKVADTGRTIVCTIHQPSTGVFMLFDKLLLLKRGGQTVYFGDLGKRAQTMVDYFEAIPGVPHLPEGYNPATWMLECIGAGVNHVHDNPVDFVEVFNSSALKREMDAQLASEGVSVPVPGSTELVFAKKRAASSWTQMTALVGRFMNLYWRTPSTNLTRLMIMPLMGLVFGLVYVGTDYTSYQGINAGVGMVFITSYFTGVVSFNSALPITSEDRPAFYRERNAQTYGAFWYFFGSTVVEIPYVFFSMLLYTVIFYWMVAFRGFGTAVLYWINTSLMVLLQTYMGQLLIYSLSSIDVAALVGVMIYSITILFYGFNPPASDIPAGYRWLYTITPQRYSISVLVSLVFSDCDELLSYDTETKQYVNVGSSLGCQPMTNPPTNIDHTTIKEYVESTFEYKHDEIWRNFGIVLLFIVVLRLMALFCLRFINHQKK
ncbi:pleiotropic drug resistance protein ABC superfamily [Phytophthora sojae]|uniref:Pleiotropic drug resistance protein ABC superfamily n=1 Tax=Phytophthora sojae (strain P6497) TaxID=1094619 RepID=G4Z0A0_PHYSP|nr:pleiotropic drug resistance protein ABC superfamily [Phytophthora sojae]EGZ24657.1 pleiotropic drug resistance protein ABC superfamily [Phytophthora sojae]|eukprot:XP_009519945.1 pleiotropic drug resistance protein ABC superfamily [Phytophthora sojae]